MIDYFKWGTMFFDRWICLFVLLTCPKKVIIIEESQCREMFFKAYIRIYGWFK